MSFEYHYEKFVSSGKLNKLINEIKTEYTLEKNIEDFEFIEYYKKHVIDDFLNCVCVFFKMEYIYYDMTKIIDINELKKLMKEILNKDEYNRFLKISEKYGFLNCSEDPLDLFFRVDNLLCFIDKNYKNKNIN
jgi:sugar-specific transcriptional regulator TrmB